MEGNSVLSVEKKGELLAGIGDVRILLPDVETSGMECKQPPSPEKLEFPGFLNTRSRLKDLYGNKLLRVLSSVEIQEMSGHCAILTALFEVALVVGPSTGHGLDLGGGGGSPSYIVC